MKLEYWSPLLIPILIGLMLPLLDFYRSLSQSEPNRNEISMSSNTASEKVDLILRELEDTIKTYNEIKNNNIKLNNILKTEAQLYLQLLDQKDNESSNIYFDYDLIEKYKSSMNSRTLESDHVSAIKKNFMSLWKEINKSVVASIISVDVWALLTLLTARKNSRESTGIVHYPIVIMIGHILLLILNSTIANEDSLVRMYISSALTMLSVFLAWVVMVKTLSTLGFNMKVDSITESN